MRSVRGEGSAPAPLSAFDTPKPFVPEDQQTEFVIVPSAAASQPPVAGPAALLCAISWSAAPFATPTASAFVASMSRKVAVEAFVMSRATVPTVSSITGRGWPAMPWIVSTCGGLSSVASEYVPGSTITSVPSAVAPLIAVAMSHGAASVHGLAELPVGDA